MTDQERERIVEVMARANAASCGHAWEQMGEDAQDDFIEDMQVVLSALDRAGYTVSGPKQESGT